MNRNRTRASSFLSNDNITRVSLKILSCNEKEDDYDKEKCKKKENESEKPDKKLFPVILSNNSNHSINPILGFLDFIWRIFVTSPESK